MRFPLRMLISSLAGYFAATALFCFIYATTTTSPTFPFGRLESDFGLVSWKYLFLVAQATYYFGVQSPVLLVCLLFMQLPFVRSLGLWVKIACIFASFTANAIYTNVVVWSLDPPRNTFGLLGSGIMADAAIFSLWLWLSLVIDERIARNLSRRLIS